MQHIMGVVRQENVYSEMHRKPRMILIAQKKKTIMNRRTIYLVGLMLVGVLVAACEKDENETITFDKQSVEIFIDQTENVKINGGVSPYTAVPADEAVAKATVTGSTIAIEGLKEGTTTVKVADKNGATASIAVKITEDPFEEDKEDATVRLAWDTLKKVDGTDLGLYELTKSEDKMVTFTWSNEAEDETDKESVVLAFKDGDDAIGKDEESEEAGTRETQEAVGVLTILVDGETTEHKVTSWRLVQAEPAEEGEANTYWIAFTANSKSGLVVAPLTEPVE